MNFNRVRSEVPLTDDDFASIRANVMREIAGRSPVAGLRFALPLAFAAAAIVAIVFLLNPKETPKTISQPAKIVARPQPDVIATALPKPPPTPATVDRRPATAHRHRPGNRQPDFQLAVHRIEIQTADPDVRIIWIAQQEEP
ncbi:MAG: hypothetical protein ACXW3E_08790 [Thermoanaerobaculia bacterium]